jgi:hypothetical protein
MNVTLVLSIVALVAAEAVPVQETAYRLEDLAFMAGCWEGRVSGPEQPAVIEERFTKPSTNVMLGTTRWLSQGRTITYEFTAILQEGADIVMKPYPNGDRSEDDFRLTQLQPLSAVFENPEHDYPKRIIYVAHDDNTLVARIDGGPRDENPTEWTMKRAACH